MVDGFRGVVLMQGDYPNRWGKCKQAGSQTPKNLNFIEVFNSCTSMEAEYHIISDTDSLSDVIFNKLVGTRLG